MSRRRWPNDARATVAVLVGLLLIEAAVLLYDDAANTAGDAPAVNRAEGHAPSSSTPGATEPPSAPNTVATGTAIVDALMVAVPDDVPGYDRGLFPHWVDADGDGCDTRCEVLERQRRTDLSGIPGGGWLSAYEGYATPDSTELDVDHVVALYEAWISGAFSWETPARTAFANDLGSGALVAVTAAANRSKSDRDPASWQPPNREVWCEFATDWVTVKVRWRLTADEDEVRALRNMLRGC